MGTGVFRDSVLSQSAGSELESPSQAPPSTTPEPDKPRQLSSDPAWLRWLLRCLITLFLICIGFWAFRAGMRLRWEIWYSTRTIRFVGDFQNAIGWGGRALRSAQILAKSPDSSNVRDVSVLDLFRGEDQFCRELVDNQSGNYQVDYPPLRLLVMALWARELREPPLNLTYWPGRWRLVYNDRRNPTALASEEIARPLLAVNNCAAAASALIVFFLVWIWVNRGGRPRTIAGEKNNPWRYFFPPRRTLVPWKPVRLRNATGFVAFPLTVCAFFYCIVIALSPAPAPPPIVALTSPPSVTRNGDRINATLSGIVNPQGAAMRWRFEWGQNDFNNHTSVQQIFGGSSDTDVTATITDLPPNAEVHYRLVARNDIQRTSDADTGRGYSRSEAGTILTSADEQPNPPTQRTNSVWLDWRQWLGIGILFGAMCWSLKVLPPAHRGWACGLVAALLLWFNPAVLMDANVWPQWDIWVLPPFLLAALLATLDWWFVAGLVLGAGVMFKGQTLIASPVLLLWPLLGMRWSACFRFIVGFFLMAGLILSPWIVLNNLPMDLAPVPVHWIEGVCVAMIIAVLLSLYRGTVWVRLKEVDWRHIHRKIRWPRRGPAATTPRIRSPFLTPSRARLLMFWSAIIVGFLLMAYLALRLWPADASPTRRVGFLLLFLGVALPPWLLRRRSLAIWSAAVLAAALWLSPFLFNSDWSWLTVGFEYGTQKFDVAAMSAGTNGNLGSILAGRFGWNLHDPAITIHPPDLAGLWGTHNADGTVKDWISDWHLDGTPMVLDLRQFLMVIFVLLLAACGLGAGMQDRRNSPRILCAFAAAWALMPNVLCQMASRYQLWGAAISCILIAVSPGLTVLHVVMSLLAAGMIGDQLLAADPMRSPLLREFFSRFSPDDGWIMILIAAIFLYSALVPGRRASPNDLLGDSQN